MNKEKEQCCFTVDHQGSGSFLDPNDFILYYIKYTFKLFQYDACFLKFLYILYIYIYLYIVSVAVLMD